MQDTALNQNSSVAALDRGIGFAIAHKSLLLFLCLLSGIVEISTAYFQYSQPLDQQQFFVVIILSLAAKAWLLSVVLIACVTYFRGEALEVSDLARKGLRYLPKIFLSYAALLSLVLCSALVLPLVFLVLFLVWAPAFCVGELFAPMEKRDDLEEEEEFDEDYFAKSRIPQPQLSLFKNKSIFELGFARSLQFGAKHAVLTFQVSILVWFANVLPSALIDLLSGSYYGFASTIAKILLSSYGDVLATAVAGSAFIILLPKEGKEEIGIAGPEVMPLLPKRARLQGRSWIFFILSLVAAGCTYVVLSHEILTKEMPSGVLSEVRKTEKVGEQFVVELYLTDTNRRFRWLNPYSFTLAFDKDVRGTLSTESAESVDKVEYRAPTRVVAFDAQENELKTEQLSPSFTPLLLKLYYELPQDLPANGAYRLRYESYLEDPRRIAEGTFGSW